MDKNFFVENRVSAVGSMDVHCFEGYVPEGSGVMCAGCLEYMREFYAKRPQSVLVIMTTIHWDEDRNDKLVNTYTRQEFENDLLWGTKKGDER